MYVCARPHLHARECRPRVPRPQRSAAAARPVDHQPLMVVVGGKDLITPARAVASFFRSHGSPDIRLVELNQSVSQSVKECVMEMMADGDKRNANHSTSIHASIHTYVCAYLHTYVYRYRTVSA
eukprot:GHVU01233002.1.p2 GENE.GHVU01233002.1~~GHVU01233002.1.p2  ORF type:complete len:124 (+),score=3.28 GHVU01233002.1:515-886(+)